MHPRERLGRVVRLFAGLALICFLVLDPILNRTHSDPSVKQLVALLACAVLWQTYKLIRNVNAYDEQLKLENRILREHGLPELKPNDAERNNYY